VRFWGILGDLQRLLDSVALARCILEIPEAAEYVLALNVYSTHTFIDVGAAGLPKPYKTVVHLIFSVMLLDIVRGNQNTCFSINKA
jgi:hypothetical protein